MQSKQKRQKICKETIVSLLQCSGLGHFHTCLFYPPGKDLQILPEQKLIEYKQVLMAMWRKKKFVI